MAAILCSSVIALFIWAMALLAEIFDLLDDCSFRDEFLVFIGILPFTYLAARPAPAFIGGRRRAIIEVERGIIVVSSSYSEVC